MTSLQPLSCCMSRSVNRPPDIIMVKCLHTLIQKIYHGGLSLPIVPTTLIFEQTIPYLVCFRDVHSCKEKSPVFLSIWYWSQLPVLTTAAKMRTVSVCVCVRARVRARVHACKRVCVRACVPWRGFCDHVGIFSKNPNVLISKIMNHKGLSINHRGTFYFTATWLMTLFYL